MRALKPDLACYHAAHLACHVTVEGGGKAETCREDGGAYRHVAVWRFLGKEERNAEASVLDDVFLQRVAAERGEARVEAVVEGLPRPGVGTVGSPEHADVAVGNVFLESLGRHDLLPANHVVIAPGERATQLPYLLLKCHSAQQVFHALFHGQFGVTIGQGGLLTRVSEKNGSQRGCRYEESLDVHFYLSV